MVLGMFVLSAGVVAHAVQTPVCRFVVAACYCQVGTVRAVKCNDADPCLAVQEDVFPLTSKLSAIRTKVDVEAAQEGGTTPCTALAVWSAMTVATPASTPLGVMSDSRELVTHAFGWVPTFSVGCDISIWLHLVHL